MFDCRMQSTDNEQTSVAHQDYYADCKLYFLFHLHYGVFFYWFMNGYCVSNKDSKCDLVNGGSKCMLSQIQGKEKGNSIQYLQVTKSVPEYVKHIYKRVNGNGLGFSCYVTRGGW